MAKSKENNGLFDVSDFTKKTQVRTAKIEAQNIHNTVTQPTYTMPHDETRSKRIQIVIKPSMNVALDRLVDQQQIKSKNDLINCLLEQFLQQNETTAETFHQMSIDDVD